MPRFLRKITIHENGCHIWIGAKNNGGYGQFHVRPGLLVIAHRFAYMNFKGSIPKGLCVCHSCDTPECVNAEHLWLGTHKDNSDDKVRKQRQGNSGRPRKYNTPEEFEARRLLLNKKTSEANKKKQAARREKYGPKSSRVLSIYDRK